MTNIYTDDPTKGGYIEVSVGGSKQYLPFSKLILSLGCQRVLDDQDKPILDIVAARGISAIGIIRLPMGQTLPSATGK